MAESEGFEPSIELPLYTLSRGAPSATRPALQHAAYSRKKNTKRKAKYHIYLIFLDKKDRNHSVYLGFTSNRSIFVRRKEHTKYMQPIEYKNNQALRQKINALNSYESTKQKRSLTAPSLKRPAYLLANQQLSLFICDRSLLSLFLLNTLIDFFTMH